MDLVRMRRATLLATFVTLFAASSFVPNKPGISQYAQAQTSTAPVQQLQALSQVGPLQLSFTKSMDLLNVRENTPLNEIIYTLDAQTEPANANVRFAFDIEGTQLFALTDRWSGQVRVAQTIDREQTGDSVSFQVVATPYFVNRFGAPIKSNVTVYIMDENDNAPKIERVELGRRRYDAVALSRLANSGQLNLIQPRAPTIKLNVSEDTAADSVLVDLIEAIDPDKASSNPLGAICLNCEPEFRLLPRTANLLNDRLEWSIVLARQLVHVPHNNTRQLHVIVSDGKFNSSILFEINIDDIQNRPPQFISSTTCVVHENTPIDRTILTLEAVDGDAIAPDEGLLSSKYRGRQIVYDFVDANEQSASQQEDFKLHPLTGQLLVANRLDREAYLNLNGVLTLTVRARELTTDVETLVANDELYESILAKLTNFIDPSKQATALTDITVILVDVNDNTPRWLNASEIAAMNNSPAWHEKLPTDRDTGRNYQLQVRENSPPGSPIMARNEMFVYDLDSGHNSEFNITLEDQFGLFDVEPKQVSGFSSVAIKLAPSSRNNPRLLDYENINERSYIIQLHAIETKTLERHRSKAQIQINVLDVNDNAPEFQERAYIANVREDAPAGRLVRSIQATDRDEVSRQLAYSLHGQSAYLFDINRTSGQITVARCQPPAAQLRPTRFTSLQAIYGQNQRPCIDFETQQVHHLTIEASDGEFSTKVPLAIYIEDVSDNAPVFSLPILDVVVEEGSERIEPPIKVEAVDVDQTSTLTYSIIEGNFEGLFSINNATGEIQLTRPIRIAHDDFASANLHTPAHDRLDLKQQQQLNKMTLIVQASDGEHTANGTIRIDILDANDNAPKFSRAIYEKEIGESSAPGQSVLTVKAFDMDRGNNARVSYRLERGSHGQFEINDTSGEISIASQAKPFSASTKENYTLEVVAYDHGLVSRSSSVLVSIKVLSSNTLRVPLFEPQCQHVTVNERTPNSTIIHRMTVSEPEQAVPPLSSTKQPLALIFEPGPIEALDKHGQPVSEIERLDGMVSVSRRSGDVVVASGLNHDLAAHINLTVFATYAPIGSIFADTTLLENQTGSPGDELALPKSVGYLLINVLDENDNAPIFGPPWVPQWRVLQFSMLEELPVGSVLTQLVASDADSKISHFEIDPPSDYFELTSPQSGVIVNKRVIDYEAYMREEHLLPGGNTRAVSAPRSSLLYPVARGVNMIQFNVFVYDSGLKQRSSVAFVKVKILPINDNQCKFERPLYEARIRENPEPDGVVAEVRAFDDDIGAEHNTVVYQLIGEQRDFFNIDQLTGLITVSARGSLGLDREQLAQPFVLLTVVGRDDLAPANQATDEEHSFSRSNKKQAPAAVTDRSCSTSVKIHIDDINDNPPLFAQKVYEVTAYDTDVVDMPLVKLLVHDEDLKHNSSESSKLAGQQANSFRILSGNINESFNVTPNGMIYVTKALNESSALLERAQPIELRVQVRQQALSTSGGGHSVPALFTDECLVRVHLARINRYAPEWRQDSLRDVAIEENMKPGTLVAQLRCHDRDLLDSKRAPHNRFLEESESAKSRGPKENAPSGVSPIRYWIKESGGANVLETREFRLDPVSGQLFTRVELDRENRDFYQLIVSCEDNGRPQSLESITPLHISVLDQDDNGPEFVILKQQQQQQQLETNEMNELRQRWAGFKRRPNVGSVVFVVEEQQSKGLQVGELKAIDRDLHSQWPISFCLIEGNEFQEFSLDQLSGILYTNQTLDREKQASYELLVKAINDGSTCEDHLATGAQSVNVTKKQKSELASLIAVRVDVQDINDNAPTFRRPLFRAAVHHRALMNTLVTQVAAHDPDYELNGALNYRITEILLYKTNPSNNQQSSGRSRVGSSVDELPGKPIKLIQSPFRIDQSGNIYTQQLLTQYQLMSMFVIHIEASEQAEPWRVASSKLEIYVYDTNNQLKIRINLHPRFVESFRYEIEQMLSNATRYKAVINRARSYYGNVAESSPESQQLLLKMSGQQTQQEAQKGATLDLAHSVPSTQDASEPNFSNIHAIFIDNHRIVSPHLVMEKFDLTSAQLFTPQSLSDQFAASKEQSADLLSRYNIGADGQANEVSSLIDKIALASIQAAEYHAGPTAALAGVDWLESPPVLYVVLTSVLVVVGLLVCLVGCCCTSRIKDHIIKTAMNKLVKQQTLQAKISERVLAATNQAYANSALQMATNGTAHGYQDSLLQQNGAGLMSSFDATKGCINNNYENMSILQRALEAGEYIDPNYTTLNHHQHINLGAHYYDASELEEQQQQMDGFDAAGDSELLEAGLSKQVSGSVISLSLDDEAQDELDGQHQVEANSVDLNMKDLHIMNGGKTTAYSNGVHGLVSSHQQRQRQQMPPNNDQQLHM